MGRASNRKKAQRQAGSSARRASQSSPADAVSPQVRRQLASVVQSLLEEAEERRQREASARSAWYGGAVPVPAEAPPWPENSLGDRFFASTQLEEARHAPCLLTAEIPDPAVIAAAPAHWNVATNALIRAVVFDGLRLDHPAVRMLLETLTPIAEAELAYGKAVEAWLNRPALYRDEDEPEFPEMDGPVFLLGASALVDAVWAAIGEDPLTEVRRVLLPVLADAVPSLDSEVVADALIGAFATEYCCELPGDADVLERIGRYDGDALENLVAIGAVPPSDVLAVGLAILSALAQLCRSGSASVFQLTA